MPRDYAKNQNVTYEHGLLELKRVIRHWESMAKESKAYPSVIADTESRISAAKYLFCCIFDLLQFELDEILADE